MFPIWYNYLTLDVLLFVAVSYTFLGCIPKKVGYPGSRYASWETGEKSLLSGKVIVSCLGRSPVKTPLPKLTLKTHKSTPTVAEDLSIDRVIVKRNMFVFGHKDSTWLM